MIRLSMPCRVFWTQTHPILWLLLVFLPLLFGLGCARREAPASPQADPANPQAASAPIERAGSLKQGVYTGAELIGEPRGRAAMEGEGSMEHGQMPMPMPGHGAMPGMPMNQTGSGKAMSAMPEHGGRQKPAQVQYTCPMHPQIIQNHPGQCPICGMTLVPKESLEKAKGVRP